MNVLVVEDEGVAGTMATTELTTALGCRITAVADPLEALARLRSERFDIAVVDMLYRAHSAEFEDRRRRGHVRLTDPRLHLSGLAVLDAASTAGVASVMWTNGEANRRLHMLFAYESLGCRHLCSKDVLGSLSAAVQAAQAGRDHLDPVLRMYLPPANAPSLQRTFFASSTKLAVWRALALGIHEHRRISDVVGVAAGSVRRGMDDMRTRLVEFDPGCSRDGSPSPELIRYASQNWEFFLDHTVREAHP